VRTNLASCEQMTLMLLNIATVKLYIPVIQIDRKWSWWVLHRWSFRATLHRKWRHRDVERPLRSDESRSVRGRGTGFWADVTRSTLSGMFYGCPGRRQQTLLWQVGMYATR